MSDRAHRYELYAAGGNLGHARQRYATAGLELGAPAYVSDDIA